MLTIGIAIVVGIIAAYLLIFKVLGLRVISFRTRRDPYWDSHDLSSVKDNRTVDSEKPEKK